MVWKFMPPDRGARAPPSRTKATARLSGDLVIVDASEHVGEPGLRINGKRCPAPVPVCCATWRNAGQRKATDHARNQSRSAPGSSARAERVIVRGALMTLSDSYADKAR